MFKRLTLAHRLWAPTVGLALMLAVAGTATTVRTQHLIHDAGVAQTAQQDKLELALQ